MTIDHERCSELLGAYVRGELEPAAAREVASHLEACADCAAEERALTALLPVQGDTLTPLERARLHRDVLSRSGAPASSGEVAGGGRDRSGWMGLVAVAASILVALAAFTYLGLGGGSENEAAQMGSGQGDDGAEPAAESGGEDAAAGGGAAPSARRFGLAFSDDGRLSRRDVARIGRSLGETGPVSELETTTDSSEAAAEEGDGSEQDRGYRSASGRVERLADEAPPEVADDVRECATGVIENEPEAVPVHGAYAFYEELDRRVLFVTFAVHGPAERRYERFMVWGWVPGRCDTPVEFLAGRTRRAPEE